MSGTIVVINVAFSSVVLIGEFTGPSSFPKNSFKTRKYDFGLEVCFVPGKSFESTFMYSMTAVMTATMISRTQNSIDPMITVLLLYSRLLKSY